ncbi:retrovirus-related pol polyprotein from transposon TNT 1-94 [Tanacetum coccineum]
MSEQMINHEKIWEKANKEQNNESVTAELEKYKERVKTFEQRLNIDLSSREKMIDSQIDNMIREKLTLKEQVDSLEDLLNEIMEVKTGFDQMDAAVQQSSVDKQCLEISKKRLKCSTSKCGSKPTGNKRNDRISQTSSRSMKNKVEAQPRKKSLFDGVHDICFLDFMINVNSHAKSTKKHKIENIWRPTSHVFTEVGLKWKPTGITFTIVSNMCPLTRITSANMVPPKTTTSHSVALQKPELKVYSRKLKSVKNIGSSKKAKIVESKNANHSEPNHTWGSNATYIPSSSSSVITGCLDCSLVSGLRMFKIHDRESLSAHELCKLNFWVQLDSGTTILQELWGMDLEVAFQKNTCFIRNLEGVDLLFGSRDTNLYTISLDDMLKTSLICLLSKASKTKSWLWHRRFSHLNFGTINKLAKDGLLTALASEQFSSGLGLQGMTPATSSSGVVPNPVSQQPCIPPNIDDWDILFQPMFDEYFTPPSNAVSQVQDAIALRAVDLANSLMSTSIDQDAPTSKSTSQGSSSNVRQTNTPFEHLGKWTKDHPIANMIGDPSRSVSTRKQLQTDAMWCYFDAFLTSDNPSHVYKLKKALYGPKQAPRAWYDMLSSFLISQHFSKGAVDLTLFTRQAGNALLLARLRNELLRRLSELSDTLMETINLGYLVLEGFRALYCDNKSVIALCCNNVQHSRAKHIDIRYHFIKEQVENEIVELYFIRTEYQLADIFTKPLPRERFNFLIEKLGMRSMSPKKLKSLAEDIRSGDGVKFEPHQLELEFGLPEVGCFWYSVAPYLLSPQVPIPPP